MVNAVKKSQNPEAYAQPNGLDYDRQSDPIKKSLMRQTVLSKSSPAQIVQQMRKSQSNFSRKSLDAQQDFVLALQLAEQASSYSF